MNEDIRLSSPLFLMDMTMGMVDMAVVVDMAQILALNEICTAISTVPASRGDLIFLTMLRCGGSAIQRAKHLGSKQMLASILAY